MTTDEARAAHRHIIEYPSSCTGCEHLAASFVANAPAWMLVAREAAIRTVLRPEDYAAGCRKALAEREAAVRAEYEPLLSNYIDAISAAEAKLAALREAAVTLANALDIEQLNLYHSSVQAAVRAALDATEGAR